MSEIATWYVVAIGLIAAGQIDVAFVELRPFAGFIFDAAAAFAVVELYGAAFGTKGG